MYIHILKHQHKAGSVMEINLTLLSSVHNSCHNNATAMTFSFLV